MSLARNDKNNVLKKTQAAVKVEVKLEGSRQGLKKVWKERGPSAISGQPIESKRVTLISPQPQAGSIDPEISIAPKKEVAAPNVESTQTPKVNESTETKPNSLSAKFLAEEVSVSQNKSTDKELAEAEIRERDKMLAEVKESFDNFINRGGQKQLDRLQIIFAHDCYEKAKLQRLIEDFENAKRFIYHAEIKEELRSDFSADVCKNAREEAEEYLTQKSLSCEISMKQLGKKGDEEYKKYLESRKCKIRMKQLGERDEEYKKYLEEEYKKYLEKESQKCKIRMRHLDKVKEFFDAAAREQIFKTKNVSRKTFKRKCDSVEVLLESCQKQFSPEPFILAEIEKLEQWFLEPMYGSQLHIHLLQQEIFKLRQQPSTRVNQIEIKEHQNKIEKHQREIDGFILRLQVKDQLSQQKGEVIQYTALIADLKKTVGDSLKEKGLSWLERIVKKYNGFTMRESLDFSYYCSYLQKYFSLTDIKGILKHQAEAVKKKLYEESKCSFDKEEAYFAYICDKRPEKFPKLYTILHNLLNEDFYFTNERMLVYSVGKKTGDNTQNVVQSSMGFEEKDIASSIIEEMQAPAMYYSASAYSMQQHYFTTTKPFVNDPGNGYSVAVFESGCHYYAPKEMHGYMSQPHYAATPGQPQASVSKQSIFRPMQRQDYSYYDAACPAALNSQVYKF